MKDMKGITLIALVVTIIVLLILAGTSIGILTGDNGIITKTQEAKEMTETAEIKEQLNLAVLSATIKKLGGSITVKDVKEELKAQGIEVDYDETEGIITIEGKYKFEEGTQEDGTIKFEYAGTKDKPAPKIESIETNYEGNKITVKVETKRNEGGTVEITLINEEGIQVETKTVPSELDNNQYECSFEGIDGTKGYKVKATAVSANGEKAEKEVNTSSVPELTSTNVILNYTVNGNTISETEWTKGPVKVSVSIKDIETEGYTIETSQDKTKWEEIATQTYTKNGSLYVRLKDSTTGQKGKEYKKTIDKIDTTKPVVTKTLATTNSIEIGATDEGSGIVGYAVTENTTEPKEKDFTSCENTKSLNVTVTEKIQNKTYYVWVKDKVGNVSEYKETSTREVPTLKGNITFEYTENGTVLEDGEWTNGSITVKATPTIEITELTLQYSTELFGVEGEVRNWTQYPDNGVEIKRNQKVYFRLWDETNGGEYATANVTQIDGISPTFEDAPTVSSPQIELKDASARAKSGYGFVDNSSYQLVSIFGDNANFVSGDLNGEQITTSEFNKASSDLLGTILYFPGMEGSSTVSGYYQYVATSSSSGNSQLTVSCIYIGDRFMITDYWAIEISGSATDDQSGIDKYYFSKDNGTTWEPSEGQTETSYTFKNLTAGETYTFKMKAVDNVGNKTTQEVTKTMPVVAPEVELKEANQTTKENYGFIGSGAMTSPNYGEFSIWASNVTDVANLAGTDCVGKVIYNSEVHSYNYGELKRGYYKINELHNVGNYYYFSTTYLGESYKVNSIEPNSVVLSKVELKDTSDKTKETYGFVGAGSLISPGKGKNSLSISSVNSITGLSGEENVGKIIYNDTFFDGRSEYYNLKVGYYLIPEFKNGGGDVRPDYYFTTRYLGESYIVTSLESNLQE